MANSAPGSLDGNARPSQDHAQPPTRTAGTERRAARRTISVALLLIGVFTTVSGFWSLFLLRGSPIIPVHAAGGITFALLSVVHVRYNRNALRLYVRDLGWSPTALRLAIAAAISLILLVPVLRLV
jgi:hypothetical protein